MAILSNIASYPGPFKKLDFSNGPGYKAMSNSSISVSNSVEK